MMAVRQSQDIDENVHHDVELSCNDNDSIRDNNNLWPKQIRIGMDHSL